MGAGDEKAVDAESHQPLLGGEEVAAATHRVSAREWVTRGLSFVALLMNCYTWWYFSSLSSEDSELGQHKIKVGWAHRVAEVAESLASHDCSGHGNVFIDTLQTSDGEVVCECHACYTGPTCAEYVPECLAAIDSGDPVMYETFWKQNADIGALVTPPWLSANNPQDDCR